MLRTVRGLYFIWWLSDGKIGHGRVLGRLDDVLGCDCYLAELFSSEDGVVVSVRAVISLDDLMKQEQFDLFESGESCFAAFKKAQLALN